MELKVIQSTAHGEDAITRVKELYHDQPEGCYFVGNALSRNWDLELSISPMYRYPILELNDWNYPDLYELMKLNLHMSDDFVKGYTEFFSNLEEVVSWRPFAIAERFVIFDILSQHAAMRGHVQKLVNDFQKVHGFSERPAKYKGFWIGPK